MVEAGRETATLAGGCFWCLEPVFEELRGVEDVACGYTGGNVAHPTYEDVCAGTTGHAEAVRINFDPQLISYVDVLRVFFSVHDPTTPDRQGADVGTQYRSAIFHHSPAQAAAAEALIVELDAAGLWEAKIVTELLPADEFYAAEHYHQGYFRRNPEQQYCRVVIQPKLARFRTANLARLKKA